MVDREQFKHSILHSPNAVTDFSVSEKLDQSPQPSTGHPLNTTVDEKMQQLFRFGSGATGSAGGGGALSGVSLSVTQVMGP